MISFDLHRFHTLETDRLKPVAGKYGKVSKKGLYTGLGIGWPAGGYLGFKTGELLNPEAELLEIYPHIDPGQFGPEEQAVYAAVVGGYLFGGLGVAKAVTRYQEIKEADLQYTRPFLKPFDSWRNIRRFLEEPEEDEDISESFERFFRDE